MFSKKKKKNNALENIVILKYSLYIIIGIVIFMKIILV